MQVFIYFIPNFDFPSTSLPSFIVQAAAMSDANDKPDEKEQASQTEATEEDPKPEADGDEKAAPEADASETKADTADDPAPTETKSGVAEGTKSAKSATADDDVKSGVDVQKSGTSKSKVKSGIDAPKSATKSKVKSGIDAPKSATKSQVKASKSKSSSKKRASSTGSKVETKASRTRSGTRSKVNDVSDARIGFIGKENIKQRCFAQCLFITAVCLQSVFIVLFPIHRRRTHDRLHRQGSTQGRQSEAQTTVRGRQNDQEPGHVQGARHHHNHPVV